MGDNNYISSYITNATTGDLLFYAKLKSTKTSGDESGSVSVTIPTTLVAGNYNLAIFMEEDNGAKKSDYITLKNNYVFSFSLPINVVFEPNGGSQVAHQSVKINELIQKPANPIREGYTFKDWYEVTYNNDGAGNVTEEVSSTPFNFETTRVSEAGLTLRAMWTPIQYKIEYELNGGTYLTQNTYEHLFVYDDLFTGAVEKPIATIVPVKQGYEFKGWFKNLTFESEKVEIITYSNLTVPQIKGEAPIKLYAKWEKIQYDVVLPELNGIKISLPIGNKNPVAYGEKLKFQVSFETGYTQNTPENLTVEMLRDTENNITLTGFLENGILTYETPEIYANVQISISGILKNSYQVYFATGYGEDEGAAVGNIKVLHGEYASDISIAKPTRLGYEFVSWNEYIYNPATGNSVVDKNIFNFETTKIVKSITLVATWKTVDYSISYQLNGGTIVAESANKFVTSYNIESLVKLPTAKDLTKEGYTFVGWSQNGTDEIITQISKGTTGNQVFTVNWNANTYVINYHYTYSNLIGTPVLNGAITEFTPDTNTFNLVEPTLEGYRFMGWFTQENFQSNSKIETVVKGTSNNLDVYAKWEAISYELCYNLNGGYMDGTVGDIITIHFDITNTFSLLNNTQVHKNGYEFMGWYTTSTLDDGTKIDVLVGKNQLANLNVYAKWKTITYNVVYILNDGVNEENPVTSFTVETPNTLLPTPTKDGYNFIGWYTNAEFTSARYVQIMQGTHEDLLFYARWQVKTYQLTVSGSNSEKATLVFKQGYATLAYGQTIKFRVQLTDSYNKSNITVTYNNLTLIADAEFMYTIENISGNIEIIISGIELNEYYVRLISLGFGQTQNLYVKHGNKVTMPNSERTGYIFNNWFEDAENTIVFDSDQAITKDYVLYGVWEIIEYNINYTLNGGTNGANPSVYNITTNNIILQNPMKFGYEFVEWQNQSGTRVTSIPKGSTGDVNLTAVWELKEFNIVYRLDGGINNNNNPKVFTVETNNITLLPATKQGYIFAGWFDENGNKIETIVKGANTQNITLYAKWAEEIEKVVVTFYANNQVYESKEIVKGSAVLSPTQNPPAENQYEFDGWYTKNGDNNIWGEKYVFGVAQNVNINLYARFVFAKLEVTYNVNGVDNVITLKYGEKISLNDLPTPSKTGYIFQYWQNLGETEAFNFNTPITQPISLVAVFKAITYHVTFEADGIILKVMEVDYNSVVDENEIPEIPTKEGYNQTTPVWNMNLSDIVVKQDLTVVAMYTANVYTIAVKMPNGTTQNITVKHGENVVLPKVEAGFGKKVVVNGNTAGITSDGEITLSIENDSSFVVIFIAFASIIIIIAFLGFNVLSSKKRRKKKIPQVETENNLKKLKQLTQAAKNLKNPASTNLPLETENSELNNDDISEFNTDENNNFTTNENSDFNFVETGELNNESNFDTNGNFTSDETNELDAEESYFNSNDFNSDEDIVQEDSSSNNLQLQNDEPLQELENGENQELESNKVDEFENSNIDVELNETFEEYLKRTGKGN